MNLSIFVVVAVFFSGLASCSVLQGENEIRQNNRKDRVWGYVNKNHEGQSHGYNTGGKMCLFVGDKYNDRFSSFNTDGHCIYVFENSGCKGRNVRIAPGTGCHSNLEDCGMNDKVSSIKAC